MVRLVIQGMMLMMRTTLSIYIRRGVMSTEPSGAPNHSESRQRTSHGTATSHRSASRHPSSRSGHPAPAEPPEHPSLADFLAELRGMRDDLQGLRSEFGTFTASTTSAFQSRQQPSSSTRSKGKKRVRGDPNRRGPLRNDFAVSNRLPLLSVILCLPLAHSTLIIVLQRHIRDNFVKIMAPRKLLDDLHLDRDLVRDFEKRWEDAHGGIEDHCTAATFTFNIDGTPHSPWNLSSGRVFAEFFFQEEKVPRTDETVLAVREGFANRVKSLRAEKAELDRLTGTAVQEKRHRRNADTRKAGVRLGLVFLSSKPLLTLFASMSRIGNVVEILLKSTPLFVHIAHC